MFLKRRVLIKLNCKFKRSEKSSENRKGIGSESEGYIYYSLLHNTQAT
jgi:hypothetical protein